MQGTPTLRTRMDCFASTIRLDGICLADGIRTRRCASFVPFKKRTIFRPYLQVVAIMFESSVVRVSVPATLHIFVRHPVCIGRIDPCLFLVLPNTERAPSFSRDTLFLARILIVAATM
ncbi:unnamed protein product [Peniophora sp. CBMAI 1063]|nr:unnamed protein product [Peniophora sp. CBMAI 1063]